MSKKNKKDKPANDENNNLSYFLNILDGLNECPGRIIIMTTNKPEFLDNALIRPGRIDYKIHMKKATIDDISNILNYYWETKNTFEIPLEWEQKVSHAELINWCRISDSISDTIFKIKKHFETINERSLNDSPSIKVFESNYVLPCPSPINLH
jgi:ATP-dependent 26S proteasome regulatory subunit